jgi:hypothetical protein
MKSVVAFIRDVIASILIAVAIILLSVWTLVVIIIGFPYLVLLTIPVGLLVMAAVIAPDPSKFHKVTIIRKFYNYCDDDSEVNQSREDIDTALDTEDLEFKE